MIGGYSPELLVIHQPGENLLVALHPFEKQIFQLLVKHGFDCLLYTSDAADE